MNKLFVFILFLVLFNKNSYSQDIKAGEIKMRNISGLTYQASVDVYYETSTFLLRPFILVNWGDGTPLDTFFNSSGSLASCVTNTIAKRYSGIHTYVNFGNFTISTIDKFRVASIVNISNSSNELMYLQYQLSVNNFLGANESPVMSYCVVDEWQCCNWQYNSAAYDSDGDSLTYTLFPSFTSNYTMPPATINNTTGTMSFSPITTGYYAFCMKIDEWRNINQNSYLVGSSFREILINVNSLVSVNEIDIENEIKFYPNPTNSILNIIDQNNHLQNAIIEIKNYMGQLVFSSSFTSQINLHNLSAGIYFLTLEDKSFKKTIKVIKE